MANHKITFALLCLLLLVGSITLVKAYSDVSECEKALMSFAFDSDECFSDMARMNQNGSLCEKVRKSIDKDICYLRVADVKSEVSLCNNIQDTNVGDLCIAKAKRDASLCENMQDSSTIFGGSNMWKDQCYASVAQSKHDASLCEKIQDSDKKKECYSLANPSVSISNSFIPVVILTLIGLGVVCWFFLRKKK